MEYDNFDHYEGTGDEEGNSGDMTTVTVVTFRDNCDFGKYLENLGVYSHRQGLQNVWRQGNT